MTIITCAWCAAAGTRTVVAKRQIPGYVEIADGLCADHLGVVLAEHLGKNWRQRTSGMATETAKAVDDGDEM
jgi:hypothetical protein